MSYLEEIQTQIKSRNINKVLQLWEEYCADDTVDPVEFIQLLKAMKTSDMAKSLGRYVEAALPLWEKISDKELSYQVLGHMIDLQVTNTPTLADIAIRALKEKYSSRSGWGDWLRLVGLAQRVSFQGALSACDLLDHMSTGHFVYHGGGWGVGEIIEVSTIREQVTVEFENVMGKKHLTFSNAFKVLEPIEESHFLVRRFAFADQLEQEAMHDPVMLIKLLLRDLGPQTAVEIKEHLYELVIPAAAWVRWWQNARAKLKKDLYVETPASVREPFRLRQEAITVKEHLQKAQAVQHRDIASILRSTYNMMRDLNSGPDNQLVVDSLRQSLEQILTRQEIIEAERLEATLLLETIFDVSPPVSSEQLVKDAPDIAATIVAMQIIALKKRACALVRQLRHDWPPLFLTLLISIQQGMLRDYLLKELNQGDTKPLLEEKLRDLVAHPTAYPDLLVWFFQKIIAHKNSDLPFSNKEGQCLFFEAFLILFSHLEQSLGSRDLLKRMYSMLSGKRYAVVREVIEGTTVEFIKEFLLLVAKCQTLSDHDLKIMRSLSEVVHPSLARKKHKRESHLDGHILWTTQEGLRINQERAKQIATIEIIENAREIETAREHGDLRENSEYKFALERRARLQGELKRLSDQLKRSRIITKGDTSSDEVDVGSVVYLEDQSGKQHKYTILGTWDADPDNNILSFQSKFAQAMIGLKEGESFSFRADEYKVLALSTIFDRKPSIGG